MPNRRNSYTAHRKIEIVNYAEIHGNRSAARFFELGESSVREWRSQRVLLSALPAAKRARRKRKEFWPDLEQELKDWVCLQRSEGKGVSTVSLKFKALQMAREKNIVNFKGSNCWCDRFMKRNRLSVRAITSTGQKLPENWQVKVEEFHLFVGQATNGVEPSQIGNMDEIPMSFDMPTKFTVDVKGTQDIKICTTGSEKCCFTVVLTVMADGEKLPPMVIFKRKTIPKGEFPKGIIVCVNPKGWMNCDMLKTWLTEVWGKRKGSFFNPKSLLVLDSARPHIANDSKALLKKYSKIAVIPGGLTKKLQPLDISVNRSFKSKIRRKWEKWMVDGFHSYTKSGRMQRASYAEICKWIVESWADVARECIFHGFRVSGIYSRDIDGVDGGLHDSSSDESDVLLQANVPDSLFKYLDDYDINCDSDSENFDGFVSS